MPVKCLMFVRSNLKVVFFSNLFGGTPKAPFEAYKTISDPIPPSLVSDCQAFGLPLSAIWNINLGYSIAIKKKRCFHTEPVSVCHFPPKSFFFLFISFPLRAKSGGDLETKKSQRPIFVWNKTPNSKSTSLRQSKKSLQVAQDGILD